MTVNNSKILRGIILTCFLINVFKAQAPKGVRNWFAYNGRYKIDKRWSVSGVAQYRDFQFPVGDMRMLLSGLGLSYKLKDLPLTFGVGYNYFDIRSYKQGRKIITGDNRIYQQVVLANKLGRVNLSHRYRMEERWLKNNTFQLGIRYRLSVVIPLYAKEAHDKSWYCAFYNEIYLINQAPIFQLNQTYGGLGYQLNERLALEVGWLTEIIQAGKGHTNQTVFGLKHNF